MIAYWIVEVLAVLGVLLGALALPEEKGAVVAVFAVWITDVVLDILLKPSLDGVWI